MVSLSIIHLQTRTHFEYDWIWIFKLLGLDGIASRAMNSVYFYASTKKSVPEAQYK